MKHEWRKHEKKLYGTKETPRLLTVEKQNFFTIEGVGDPNEEEFSEKIGVLYSLAYAVKMMPKSGFTPEGYFDYTVYPLEGIWTGDISSGTIDKSTLEYKIMIRQPDFVTEETAAKAMAIVQKKKPHKFLDAVRFETIEDGLSLQILHVGSYDDEPRSFKLMKDYMVKHQLEQAGVYHREIYLSDFRKVTPEKLKTLLRYTVKSV